jgi:hypothetical protein
MLPLFPELHGFPQRVASIQSTPHVAHCLLVASLHIDIDTLIALTMASCRDIRLADRAEDGPAGQITIKREEALDVHVQILADGLVVAVPATDTVDQFERQRIDRSRRRSGRAGIQARHARGTP